MEYQWGYNSTGFLTNQLDSKNIAQIHPFSYHLLGDGHQSIFIAFLGSPLCLGSHGIAWKTIKPLIPSISLTMAHMLDYCHEFIGHVRNLNWRYLPYIRPIFQAYVREYPSKIWPYMVQYLHFRILEFPLIIMEHPIKMDDLGYHYFRKPPFWNDVLHRLGKQMARFIADHGRV